MGPILFILWIVAVIAGWVIAADRHGNGIGCLWAVILFILGPLAPVIVLLYYFLGKDDQN